MTDIIQIFKEIQMIRIDIQDDADLWEKVQKTVGIFTGFCHKNTIRADTDITMNSRKNTANGNGWIRICGQQNMGYHRSRGGLAMGTGYGNRQLIISHQLAQKLSTGQHWKASSDAFCIFWIIRMNRSGINHQIYSILNILRFLTVENLCPGGSQPFGQIGFPAVRTGYGEAAIQKNSSQTTHADAADSDEMYMNR